MSVKTVEIDGVGAVKLVKSTRNKSIRLSIGSDGTVRVSMPYWTPYAVGIAFVHQHTAWITAHAGEHVDTLLHQDQKIGKLHHLHFVPIPRVEAVSSRVTATKIYVKYHADEKPEMPAVQERARRATLRALKKETEQLLGPRVQKYAAEHGFHYRSVSAKQLKRRWGSCDSHHNLVFNFFLMQLPWELIDYVILHELTHTEHLHHGASFWERLTQVCPRALDLKHQIKLYQPLIQPASGEDA